MKKSLRLTAIAVLIACFVFRSISAPWNKKSSLAKRLEQIFDHLRVSELITKGVEGLNLVSDEELFIIIVNGTENVGFAERLTTILPDHGQGGLKQKLFRRSTCNLWNTCTSTDDCYENNGWVHSSTCNVNFPPVCDQYYTGGKVCLEDSSEPL